MWKCGLCTRVSKPRQAQKRHVEYRPNGQIRREIPICSSCAGAIADGVEVRALYRREEKAKPKKRVVGVDPANGVSRTVIAVVSGLKSRYDIIEVVQPPKEVREVVKPKPVSLGKPVAPKPLVIAPQKEESKRRSKKGKKDDV